MKIREIIIDGTNKLKEAKQKDCNIKARVLLQHILKEDKNYLTINIDKELDKKEEERYQKCIQELIQGKPLQYITKHQEFMGLDFYIDENVLIPQPDTEILVEESIKEIGGLIENRKKDNVDKRNLEKNDKIKILDMCTGSGIIAISIAKHFEEKYTRIRNGMKQGNNVKQEVPIEIYGIDISKEALKIAKRNANLNQVQVTWIQSDMFQEIEKNTQELFDVIVSNPPYIETDVIETLSKEVKQEPHIALDGGKDGINFYRIIAKEGRKYLKENGCILLEIGYNQKESVTKLFEKKNAKITCIQDLGGNDRVIRVKKSMLML